MNLPDLHCCACAGAPTLDALCAPDCPMAGALCPDHFRAYLAAPDPRALGVVALPPRGSDTLVGDGRCRRCGVDLGPAKVGPHAGGRRRVFCSNACRVAWHQSDRRERALAATTTPTRPARVPLDPRWLPGGPRGAFVRSGAR